MSAKDEIRAYAVLIRTRTARGQRLELELRELVQAHAQKIELEQEAQKKYEAAGLKLAAHVQHVRDLLSSREVTHMDAIVRERAHIDFLGDAQKEAHAQCERAAQEVAHCLQRCDEMRHHIVINDERVSTLRAQQQDTQARQAQVTEDAEEDEREEAHAAGHVRRKKEASV
jgi:hypothetical protein